MKTLLLKFAGPLQSWGTNSNFETRQTDLYPSKSAIIGLIAASFGYRRDQDEEIRKLNDLKYAVRIDQAGNLLRDYHTARKYKANGDFERTYVTNRYYLEDAIFIVAISHEDEDFIENIYQNIKNPYFQIFMGRRSCPVSADFLVGIFEEDILKSLKNYPWQAKSWYRRNHSNKIPCYMDETLLPSEKSSSRKDKVISFSQKERKFQYRNEVKIELDLIDLDDNQNKEHDAFGLLEEY